MLRLAPIPPAHINYCQKCNEEVPKEARLCVDCQIRVHRKLRQGPRIDKARPQERRKVIRQRRPLWLVMPPPHGIRNRQSDPSESLGYGDRKVAIGNG